MNKALLNRRARQVHLWLGIIIGAQVGLWLISGLFMTIFPIEEVRGEHLRTEEQNKALSNVEDLLAPSAVLEMNGLKAETMTLRYLLDEPVWAISAESGRSLVSARSGTSLSPLSEKLAEAIAANAYGGTGSLISSELLIDPPREYGRPGPVWLIEFGEDQKASFYVDALDGEVRAVRTKLWRTFDFMWGLHIMDWSSRENFNSWWIKSTAVFAVFFFFAGLIIAILQVTKMIQRRRQ